SELQSTQKTGEKTLKEKINSLNQQVKNLTDASHDEKNNLSSKITDLELKLTAAAMAEMDYKKIITGLETELKNTTDKLAIAVNSLSEAEQKLVNHSAPTNFSSNQTTSTSTTQPFTPSQSTENQPISPSPADQKSGSDKFSNSSIINQKEPPKKIIIPPIPNFQLPLPTEPPQPGQNNFLTESLMGGGTESCCANGDYAAVQQERDSYKIQLANHTCPDNACSHTDYQEIKEQKENYQKQTENREKEIIRQFITGLQLTDLDENVPVEKVIEKVRQLLAKPDNDDTNAPLGESLDSIKSKDLKMFQDLGLAVPAALKQQTEQASDYHKIVDLRQQILQEYLVQKDHQLQTVNQAKTSLIN
ncbi:9185_t:CDS:2, partial [Ambispora leptoticha]